MRSEATWPALHSLALLVTVATVAAVAALAADERAPVATTTTLAR